MARHSTASSLAQVCSTFHNNAIQTHSVSCYTDTEPAVLGALEGVLEASTVYAESEKLANGSVAPAEAAAAAKVVQRVAADKTSQVASAPAGIMVSGNPFAPGTHTPGIPEGNPFAPGAHAPGNGQTPPQQQDVQVEAEIWHRAQPSQPSTSNAPTPPFSASNAPTPPSAAPSGRVMGGPPPSVAASNGGPSQPAPSEATPSTGPTPGPTTGPFSSKVRC